MLANKCLRHMATPTDGIRCRKRFGELLRTNLVPLNGYFLGANYGWPMIRVMEWLDRFFAVHALFTFKPFRSDCPYTMALGVFFDLNHAILATIVPLRPAGTIPKFWVHVATNR